MASLRTDVFLLLMLVPSTEAAEATSDPVVCYILDGVLLLYCIIATALFVRQKFLKPLPEPKDDPTSSTHQTSDYEELNTDPQSGATRTRRQEASSDIYQSLKKTDDESDTYHVIETKGRARRSKKEKKPQVNESSPRKKEKQDSLEKRPPAPPPPN